MLSRAFYKKAHKHAQPEFEEEFIEDEFDDLEEVASSSAPAPGAQGQTRAARFAQAQADVQAALKRAKQHGGRSHLPSTRLLNHLVRTSEPAQLPEVLRLVAKWRAASLPALGDETAALLLRRLAQLEADDGHAAVEVLANRDLYGVDVPADLKALYPVFSKLSRPPTTVEGEPATEAEADPAAATGAYRILSSNPADLAFVLHDLAAQHAPASAATDAVVLLSTLAAAVRAGELSTPRVGALVAEVQAAGEEALVRQAQSELGAKWRDIVRMRARVVAEKMREGAHAEVEGWGRGKTTQDSAEADLEAQNDQHLNDLHSKISALRGVTTDIYQDSRAQNTLLDGTSNAFDSFKTSLSNTSTRFVRSVQSGKGGARIQLGIVAGFVLLFLLYKVSTRGGAAP
ncbi:hypothetical protein JCM10450v2_006969 [Rhodotorula kratochvilovae]